MKQIIESLRKFHRSYYLIIVFFVVVFLASTLLFTSPITEIQASEIGTVTKLSITFWIGLILLGYVWYISRESKYCLIIAFILTLSYLYVVPIIVKVPPGITPVSYYPLGESSLINSAGYLADRPFATLTSYLYWPVFLYLASAFTLVTGMPHSILLKYIPILIISLYGLLAFLILRVKLKTSYSILGAAWFVGSFFIRWHYFGPPSIAYIFFLLIFLILSWLYLDVRVEKRRLVVLLLFLFTMTVLTHALTALMSLVVMVALYATHKLIPKKSLTISAKLCLFSMITLLSYNMFVAHRFFNLSVQTFYEIFLGVKVSAIYKEPARLIGSTALLVNYAFSWSIVLLNVFIAFVAVFMAIKERSVKKDYFLFYLISLVMLGLFGLVGKYPSHEESLRAFMFGLIPLTFICINLLARKPKILLIILVALLFLNIPAQYGGDSYRLATETELNGAAFFTAHTAQKISLLYCFSPYIRYHDPLKDVKFLSLGTLPYTSPLDPLTLNKAVNDADYTILSDLQDNYYLYYLGATPFQQIDWDTAHFNRIYDNDKLRVINHSNKTLPP